ncbi:MAG: PEP-CTERM sorting domain-containing protein [Candidatus Hydrogenedentes bacterium]|nr:PEP-CTERM sorting domain-containing protein [Candidatus Hydrogenedentota bacterium]
MYGQSVARFLMVAALFSSPVWADIIYENGETLFQGGLLSTVDTHFIAADNFVLDEGADILNDIHWWGYYAHDEIPALDDFTVYIYSDAGGEPGAVLHTLTDSVLRTDTGGDAFGEYTEFEYHMDISAIDLDAGTTYWLAIQNDVDCNWFWSISDFNGGDAHQKLQNWVNYEVEEAFYLTGPGSEIVPEPSSVLLMGAGLVGLAIHRRRKSFRGSEKH